VVVAQLAFFAWKGQEGHHSVVDADRLQVGHQGKDAQEHVGSGPEVVAAGFILGDEVLSGAVITIC
jgi:hypothetical protein